jgi:hypothetical protein
MGLKQDPHGDEFCPISGKVRLTKSQAKSMAKRQKRGTWNLQAYRCRTCGGWHVGNVRRFP